MYKSPILYSRANTGKIQQWQIIVDGDAFYTIAGQVDGQLTQSLPNQCFTKNLNKKNQTTPEEQARIEADAKYEKKLKEGYKEDINKVDEFTFFECMLAKSYEDYKHKIKFPVAIEDKKNGIRCLIYIKDGELGAFSRKGEQFFCIDHILDSVTHLFNKSPQLVLDGELFNPLYKNELNKIASLVSVNRKEKDVTEQDVINSKSIVQYHVYDGIGFNYINNDTPYIKRKEAIFDLIKGLEYIFYCGYDLANNAEQVEQHLKLAKKEKREGIMVKILDGKYENKRSKNILKYKIFHDKEYKIIGFREGSGNWAGCVKNVICALDKPATNGKTEFDSNIRGTREELAELWQNQDKYIGQYATVEYQELSPYGIPLIPYCSQPFIRNYE